MYASKRRERWCQARGASGVSGLQHGNGRVSPSKSQAGDWVDLPEDVELVGETIWTGPGWLNCIASLCCLRLTNCPSPTRTGPLNRTRPRPFAPPPPASSTTPLFPPRLVDHVRLDSYPESLPATFPLTPAPAPTLTTPSFSPSPTAFAAAGLRPPLTLARASDGGSDWTLTAGKRTLCVSWAQRWDGLDAQRAGPGSKLWGGGKEGNTRTGAWGSSEGVRSR